ncbi:MAG: hypothetical protein WAW02_10190 [Sideroxyarcus sp.]
MGCNDLKVGNTGSNQFERTRYFSRQLITADDLTQDQDYFREKMRMHNRMLHGWGIVCGLDVTRKMESMPSMVTIGRGYALSPQGDEIFVPTEIQFDLAQCVAGQTNSPCFSPCGAALTSVVDPQKPFYIAIRYAQCMSHPVRLPPVGCGCDDSVCEYSRIREGYEVACLGKDESSDIGVLPSVEEIKRLGEIKRLEEIKRSAEKLKVGLDNYSMPCPDCSDDPWVLLSLVTPPNIKDGVTDYLFYDYVRRIL